jgi:regulatory protein
MRRPFRKRQNNLIQKSEDRSTLNLKEIEDILFNKAARYIALRERSEKEITVYLSKKIERYHLLSEENEELICKVIEKLKELELLSDKRFIDWWVTQRSYFKPRGSYLLHQELQQKGVNRDEINFYFEDNKLNELELAKKAIEKKLRTFSALSTQEQEKKCISFLMRRGFSFSIAKKAFEDLREKMYNESKL